jgi:hypothetical protein
MTGLKVIVTLYGSVRAGIAMRRPGRDRFVALSPLRGALLVAHLLNGAYHRLYQVTAPAR